jgi:D-glycero-beta-D-manno-heptose-7-phosphate kinase
VTLQDIFKRFGNLRVMVAGDLMIDAYYRGSVNRISPEAPVPVVNVSSSENRPGGAANVALNLVTLGAKAVICSVVGADQKGRESARLLAENGIETSGLIESRERPTTVKTRIISAGQHLLRVDEEVTTPLSDGETRNFLAAAEGEFERGVDLLIFEDYNKGVLTPEVIRELTDLAHRFKIPTAVDPKKDNFFAYRGVTLFKPNLKELREGLKIDLPKTDTAALEAADAMLRERLGHEISLITLSEAGIFARSKSESVRIAAHPREIMDVSGAGDSVIAVAGLCLAAGADLQTIARLANLAGGLVCEKSGVVPILADDLLREAEKTN